MWTLKPAAMPVQFPRGRTGASCVVSSLHPPRNYEGTDRRFNQFPVKSQTSESESRGGLGQKIIVSTADANPTKPIAKKEISASDVLWAIQRAAEERKRTYAGKKKLSKKIKGVAELSSSAGESTGDDYSNVRPLRIQSDWGHRLDQFEKLLKEFENTEL